MKCTHCYITCSSQWRKIDNIRYCNACATCYRRNGHFVPVEEIYAKVLIQMSKNII